MRHNLHVASHTGDFTFFKALQAHYLLEGTDHVAKLTAALGDAADSVLASLDNFNSVIAYVHEDAYKNLYEGVKTTARDENDSHNNYINRRAIFYVDASSQKEKAEKAIDKMANSAITIIFSQPATAQEEAANAWMVGMTFVADAIEVCLAQINTMEHNLDDFIRLEHSWAKVQSAVSSAINAIKGIFNLMAPNDVPDNGRHARSEHVESTVRSMLRRMSSALTSTTSSGAQSRKASSASLSSVASSFNSGSSSHHGSKVHSKTKHSGRALSSGDFDMMPTIPPTPADALTNPFETSFSEYAVSFTYPIFPLTPSLPPPIDH